MKCRHENSGDSSAATSTLAFILSLVLACVLLIGLITQLEILRPVTLKPACEVRK